MEARRPGHEIQILFQTSIAHKTQTKSQTSNLHILSVDLETPVWQGAGQVAITIVCLYCHPYKVGVAMFEFDGHIKVFK